MPYTRRQMDTTAQVARGTKTTRASLTRALRSSNVGAIAALPLVPGCSTSTRTMAVLIRSTVFARWGVHFKLNTRRF